MQIKLVRRKLTYLGCKEYHGPGDRDLGMSLDVCATTREDPLYQSRQVHLSVWSIPAAHTFPWLSSPFSWCSVRRSSFEEIVGYLARYCLKEKRVLVCCRRCQSGSRDWPWLPPALHEVPDLLCSPQVTWCMKCVGQGLLEVLDTV